MPNMEMPFRGRWIWKLKTLPRIQFFVWQCMHHSICVRECLSTRGMAIENSCPICLNGLESIIHALRDCPLAKAIWHQLGVLPSDLVFFAENLKEWLFSNCNAKPSHRSGQLSWFQVFLFTIWMIWKNRNHHVFKGEVQNPNVAKEILARVMEYNFCASNHTEAKRVVLKSIRWEKPNAGWKKLNTDGSLVDSLGLVGGRGVVRDEQGNWVLGYARRIGPVNSFLAELWSLRDGLLLCVQAQVQALIVEMDTKALVDAFSNQTKSNAIVSSLMEDCRHLATQIPQVSFRHIYREANMYADHLAKLGAFMETDFVAFSSPLVDIISFFEADSRGLYVNRLCPASGFPA